ncbi:MAG: hypothetical protein ACE37F_15485 [Nannocystaceae bacterium]|nr:hypothetical protein [bacterium]
MAGTLSRLFAFALTATALVACDGAAGTPIGPEGGVVVSDDGRLTLEIPAGALDGVVDVSIHAVEDGPEGGESAIRAYALEPMGTTLILPATVEYDWTALSSADALSLEGSTLEDPTLVMERGAQWRALADHTVDTDAGYVAGSAHYFGTVAIVD